MSLANIYNQIQQQFQVSSIDAGAIELRDVPISGGGGGSVGNLQQVLNTGADGGNQNITNLNGIQMNGYLQLTNSSINTVQLNTGGNSWQLVTSNGEFFIQNYVNSSLVSSSFQIDNDGNVLIGNTQTTTPYLYVMGGNGPGRVYDTIYNPLPSVPSGGSNFSVISKDWNLQGYDKASAIVYNSIIKASYFNVYGNLNPSTNFENMPHFKVNISSITFTINPVGVFDMSFLLIDNKTDLTTLTLADIAKNKNVEAQQQVGGGQQFILNNIDLELYDTSGINSMSIIAQTNYTGTIIVNSVTFSVLADNGTYTYLPLQLVP